MTQVGIWDQSNEGYNSILKNSLGLSDHFQGAVVDPAWTVRLGSPTLYIAQSCLSFGSVATASILKPYAPADGTAVQINARVRAVNNAAGTSSDAAIGLRTNAVADAAGEGILVLWTTATAYLFSLDAGVYTVRGSFAHTFGSQWVNILLQRAASSTNWTGYVSVDGVLYSSMGQFVKAFSPLYLQVRGTGNASAGMYGAYFDFVDVQ